MAGSAELECPSCGAKLGPLGTADPTERHHCGTHLLLESEALAVTPEAAPLACPMCGRVDGIQVVPSTCVSDASIGYHSGPWGPAQMESSSLLSPPSKPEPPVRQYTPGSGDSVIQISQAQRGLEE
jgi:hypothetical protein